MTPEQRLSAAAYAKAWRAANPAKPRPEQQRLENIERCKRRYRAKREQILAYHREHRLRNRDRINDRLKRWREANRPKMAAHAMARYAAKLRATPAWADLKAIEAFYIEAARLTRETGIPHQVDHIIPLRGRNVCGFHIETNLQILTAEANRRKKNNFEESIA